MGKNGEECGQIGKNGETIAKNREKLGRMGKVGAGNGKEDELNVAQ